MTASTPGILQSADPGAWKTHRFGLSPARWSRLSGQAFWITGAGTGYGRSIAVALAAAGGRVFLSGRRRAKLEESLEEMRALGVDSSGCRVVPLAITDESQVADGCRRIADDCGSLLGLVHCAALPQIRRTPWPLSEEGGSAFETLLRVNALAPGAVTRAATPLLFRGEAARVLFLSSEAGWAATPGFGPYNVSKAALNSLGYSIAEELALRFPGRDVQANVLVPGEARTEMNQGSTTSPYALAAMALTLLSHPPGGPNGRFFHRDGRHLAFGHSLPYERPLT